MAKIVNLLSKYSFFQTPKHEVFSFRGALPPDPHQGLCPWTPLGAQPPESHYRFALQAHHVLAPQTEKQNFANGCNNRKCGAKKTVRKYSFFAGSHLSLATITHLLYYWTYRYTQLIVRHETRLSRATVVDFCNFCREVCCVILRTRAWKSVDPGNSWK